MAEILKVDTAQLTDTASQFKSHQQSMMNAVLTMSNAVRQMGATWNGAAAEAFDRQFEAMYKNLAQTEQKMTDVIEELLKAHDIFEEYENKLKTLADSMDVGSDPFSV